MKTPNTMTKLVKEIDAAFANGSLTHPIQYSQAIKLPYLNAVIQESLRVFPPFAVPMPRYAPAAGLEVSGHYLKSGTKVCAVSSCTITSD
jgi:cytochrome P450